MKALAAPTRTPRDFPVAYREPASRAVANAHSARTLHISQRGAEVLQTSCPCRRSTRCASINQSKSCSSSFGRDLAQDARLCGENRPRRQSDALAQHRECFGTELVGSEVGDLLPQHERKRRVGGRLRLPTVLLEQSRDDTVKTRR